MNTSPPSFEEFDKLGLKPFCERLEQFLLVEHDFVEGSLVVSLSAPFGTGKTTFLTMWETDLKYRRQENEDLPMPVFLNAWENDYCGDPLLSIIADLIQAIESYGLAAGEDAGNKLREAAKDIGWFLTGLSNGLVSSLTGIDPIAAAEFAQEKKEGRQSDRPDFVTLYEERTKSLKNLKQTLREIFGGENPKVFVFVDELDRCRPDFAISYLETVKHIFDIHGLVFVLAVDSNQLASSARVLFGQDLNIEEYFRKFIQRQFSLPDPDEMSLLNLGKSYVKKYFESEGSRISLFPINDEHRIANIADLMFALKLTPRQSQEVFRISGHMLIGEEQNRGQMRWAYGCGIILMAALKVGRSNVYKDIGKEKIEHFDVGKFLKTVSGEVNGSKSAPQFDLAFFQRAGVRAAS